MANGSNETYAVISSLTQALHAAIRNGDIAEQDESVALLDAYLLSRGVIVRPSDAHLGIDIYVPNNKDWRRCLPSNTMSHLAGRIFQYEIGTGEVTGTPKNRYSSPTPKCIPAR